MTDSKKKRPKNRRERAKYPALQPELNLKSRFDLIDYDYLNKLSPEEKKWLNNFTEEYTNANFKHGDTRVHPVILSETEFVKGSNGKIKRDIYKHDSEKRNNQRNNCALTKANAGGFSLDLDTADKYEKQRLKKLGDINESDDDSNKDTEST
jgi:hypothetical protein